MTAYYLIPTKWHPLGRAEQAVIAKQYNWIRLVECSHQKKQDYADKYERELNDGELFSMEKVVAGTVMFDVFPCPYSQARDYVTFSFWPCNKES